MKVSRVIHRMVRDSIRMYFAPLKGAYKGIRDELRLANLEADQHRKEESDFHRQRARTT
jgi:hypothetical protein